MRSLRRRDPKSANHALRTMRFEPCAVSTIANREPRLHTHSMTAAQILDSGLPSGEEQEEARDLLRELARLRGDRVVRIRSSDPRSRVDVVLPARFFHALLELLRHNAEGNAVTLVPVHAELTTQEAADLLNVSRPHLVKLLEQGELPFHRTGRHRRIKAQDLFAYREERRRQSEAAFQELADLSQEHDLGY